MLPLSGPLLLFAFASLRVPPRFDDSFDDVVPEGKLLAVYPHSNASYCEGLVFDNAIGVLVESSGEFGSSAISTIDLETGVAISRVTLPQKIFGEGTTLVRRKGSSAAVAVQLTYEAQTAYFYDVHNATRALGPAARRQAHFTTATRQGWGLTSNGTHLIASDGSSALYFFDTTTLAPRGSVQMWYDDASVGKRTPLAYVNELEWLPPWVGSGSGSGRGVLGSELGGGESGVLVANLFYPNYYLLWRINLVTGEAKMALNITTACAEAGVVAADYDHVFNGIAIDTRAGSSAPPKLLLTGKFWSKLLVVDAAPLYAEE